MTKNNFRRSGNDVLETFKHRNFRRRRIFENFRYFWKFSTSSVLEFVKFARSKIRFSIGCKQQYHCLCTSLCLIDYQGHNLPKISENSHRQTLIMMEKWNFDGSNRTTLIRFLQNWQICQKLALFYISSNFALIMISIIEEIWKFRGAIVSEIF